MRKVIGKLRGFVRRSPRLALISALVILLSGGTGVYAGLGGFTAPREEVNLDAGLVGWWKLNGNANDSSGNGRHGTVTGAVPTADRFGNANSAYSFNGSTDFIDAGTNPITGNNAFTLSSWINAAQASKYMGAIAIGTSTTGQLAFIGTVATAQVGTSNSLGGGFYGSNYGSGYATLNEWTHIALTFSGGANGTWRLFINGVQTHSGISSPNLAATHLRIGRIGSDTTYNFNGKIDDARIYNRTLDASEISTLGSDNSVGRVQVADTQKGLVGHWKMDGDAKDSSAYRNHGTVTGASLTSDRQGRDNSAYTFGVSGSRMQIANPIGQTGQMSASVWYKRDESQSSTTWRTILAHQSADIHQLILNNTTRQLGIWDGSWRSFGYTVPDDGKWHNYAVIYDSGAGTAKLYVDGSFYAQITVVLNLATYPIAMIGNWSGNTYWSGHVDDVRIYNRALGPDEVKQLYDQYDANISVSSLQKQLVGHWSLDGDAKDRTPYRNHGVVTGATLATDRRNRASSAYNFDGSTGYIDIASTNLKPSSEITVSGWFYRAAQGPGYNPVVEGAGNLNSGTGYYLGFASNTQEFRWYVGDGTYVISTANLTNGQWYHAAGVFSASGGFSKLYINGVEVDSDNHTKTAISYDSNPVTIGRLAYGVYTGHLFNGIIDDIRIWSRALSAAEVQALYESY